MSRVLVVGMGVPGFVRAERHAGPGLRSAHFAGALAAAGHDVLVVGVLDEGEAAPLAADLPDGVSVEFVTERALLEGAAMRARIARFSPHAVVGATVYASAIAARLRLGVPLWADLFGDIMAEAQAKAARRANDWSLVHFWTLLRAALEAGDRFSAVSYAQSHAVVGQLGLAGRLSARTAGEDLVSVIPCAAEPQAGKHAARAGQGVSVSERQSSDRDAVDRDSARRELGFGDDDFVLLWSGSVNTWCDVETLGRALEEAMAREPRLCVVVTGGAIPGHDEESHRGLLAAVAALPASRVRVLGWIDSARLAGLYAACDLALHVERRLYERRLGAENRVVEWLAHGLACVTTAQSESGAQLVAEHLSIACPPADAKALAAILVDAARGGAACVLGEARERGAQWVAAHRSPAGTAAPLLEWAASPCFARDRDDARLLRLGLVSQPATSAEMLEAYVAELPMREIARRGARWLARRAAAATGRLARRAATFLPSARRAGAALIRLARGRGASAIVALVAATAAAFAGCHGKGGAERPNVLLITIDTLRADHLGAYGYGVKPSPTPALDALAARSLLFETAVTSAPETAPGLATILTGVYQDRHGVLYNRASIVQGTRTLAERLKDAGYSTTALIGNWLADPKRGFARGFDRYEVPPAAQTMDDRLVALARDFFATQPKQPWFLWVHMMDPHGPYTSAPPAASQDFDYAKAPLAKDGEFPVSKSNFGLGVIPAYQRIEGATRLSDYVRRYDGDVNFTDTQVGALVATLEASGQRDRTVVVVTADHGESLTEHDEFLQHGWFTYDATVRVPLVVSWPARLGEGRRVTDQVCTVDIVPSLLDLAGIAGDGKDFDGRSFVPEQARTGAVSRVEGEAASVRDAGCFSVGGRTNHVFALRTAEHKLILTPAGTPRDPRAAKGTVTSDPERIELYDLGKDPGESTDIAAANADLADRMRTPVTSLRSRFRANGWRW